MQCVCDVQVRLWTALVKDFIPFPSCSGQFPLFVPNKAAGVQPLLLYLNVNRPPIVRPGTKLDVAGLLIEGEPGVVELAGGGEDVRGNPEDGTGTLKHNLTRKIRVWIHGHSECI